MLPNSSSEMLDSRSAQLHNSSAEHRLSCIFQWVSIIHWRKLAVSGLSFSYAGFRGGGGLMRRKWAEFPQRHHGDDPPRTLFVLEDYCVRRQITAVVRAPVRRSYFIFFFLPVQTRSDESAHKAVKSPLQSSSSSRRRVFRAKENSLFGLPLFSLPVVSRLSSNTERFTAARLPRGCRHWIRFSAMK